jgi:hypothetical protein
MSDIGPFIVPRPPLVSGGVDFLGLRQTNLDLMAEAIPGINNTTVRIRPFTLMAWITWKFKFLSKGLQPKDIAPAYDRFRERVEILYSWSHWINGRRDLPGLGSVHPPIGGDGKAPLTFDAWKRIPASTSYFAAIQYGPASKSGSGLGLLESEGPRRPLIPTALGNRLASALDASLRDSPSYDRLLDNLGEQFAGVQEVSALYPLWALDKPTDIEREVFREVLFSSSSIDQLTRRRSEMTDRVINIARKEGPLSIQVLRSLVCVRQQHDKDDVSLRWIVLQLRQAQRLGLETLFHYLEYNVVEFDLNRRETIGSFAESISLSDIGPANRKTVSDWIKWCKGRWPTKETFLKEISLRGECSPLVICEKVHKLIASKLENDKKEATAMAFTLLIIVAHGLSIISQGAGPLLSRLMHWGGDTGARDRFSLEAWESLVERERQSDISNFLDQLIFGELLSRHVFTASRRADGSSNRLRIAYDGDRWTKFVNAPAPVPLTPDRLEALTSLMIDCELLNNSEIVR